MVLWFEVNDFIYNKKLNVYKDFRKKDVLWEFKVVDMDKDVDILKIWYRFICICFICFMYRKFGDGFGELIERDCWIF